MKPSVRSLFIGVAVAFFFTLTLAAFAQEKPAAPPDAPPPPATTATEPTPAAAIAATPDAPAAIRPLRRLDETAIEKSDDAPAPATKTKKSRAQHIKERTDAARQHAQERAAAQTGEAVVNVFADSFHEKDKRVDAVVAVFGNATSEGEVVDAVVSVFGNNRVTGPVGAATVAVFGNSYVNSRVAEAVVVVFGDLELGPDARIEGPVVCVGGTVTRNPDAVVKGGVKNIISTKVAWLRAWLHECFLKARPLAFAPDLGWAWTLALGCLAFYALAALLFTSGVEKCLTTLETRPGFSVLAALLTTLITPVLTILLVMTGVGLIAVPFIGAGMLCATLFGKVVVLAWLGRRITRLFGNGPLGHVAVAVIVGGLIVLLLYTVPVLGFLLFKLIGWIGLGAVIYTLVLGMKREKPATPPPFAGPTAPAFTPDAPASAPVPATFPLAATEVPATSSGFVGAAAEPAAAPASVTAPVSVVSDTTPLGNASLGFAAGAGSISGEPSGVLPPVPPPIVPPPVVPPVTPPPPAPASAPVYTPPVRRTSVVSAATLPRAGFWIRMGALALDGILIAMVVGFTSDILPRFLKFDHGPGGVLIVLAIYGAAMWKTKGTTIGGIVCGLRVVRLDDREIDWPTAVVRALSCFLSLVVGGLGFLWVVFDHDKQSWHDKIAGTTVVRTPKGVALL